MMKRLAFAAILNFLLITAYGQETSVFPSPFRELTPINELPETVMYTKTMVLVDAPRQISRNETWRTFADKAHKVFQEAGIDAVAYYHIQDAQAGRDVSGILTEQLVKRNIKNVILLSYAPRERSSQRCGLLITTFNEKASFVSPEQSAYMLTGNDWEGLLGQFGKFVLRNRYETQNFLISDLPEFFTGAGNVVKGRRAEGFAQDLKLDKLAVPRMSEEEASTAPQLASNDTSQLISSSADPLTRIMEAYPYEYGLVDPSKEEDQIRQDGYQFILLRLHSTEKNLHTMLGYEAQEGETPDDTTPVYKYYVKHIYTGDIYLGDTWDAAPTWQEALQNHLQHLRSDFNIGQ
uniref:TPM domain-containing protein n=1 Tax=Roseihalotalea indica TaxID=2867963 RepID=A0AA49JJJ7_9BACT|nr:hypothetical protein K4G66_14085 [Tunicatimonas sp. TK19036]